MNTFIFVVLGLAVATVSAGHLGHGVALVADVGYAHNPAAHIPSGSVGVDAHGAVVAGPAGSVKTDNGLHGHGAGSVVSGPSGEIATREGHTVLKGPGSHHGDGYHGAAPAVVAAPVFSHAVVAAPAVSHAYVAGPAVSHAVVAPAILPASTIALEPAVSTVHTWGPAGVINAGWTQGGVYPAHGYGLLGHGHGW